MPSSLFKSFWLVAYPTLQAVQAVGSTALGCQDLRKLIKEQSKFRGIKLRWIKSVAFLVCFL